MSDLTLNVPIYKAEPDQRMVYGWASVTRVDGQDVVDHEGDMIAIDDLQKAVRGFLTTDRRAGVMHLESPDGDVIPVGQIVDSVVMTKVAAEALGAPSNTEGWFVGVYVEDDDVWQLVKSGMLKAFSIGGKCARQAL